MSKQAILLGALALIVVAPVLTGLATKDLRLSLNVFSLIGGIFVVAGAILGNFYQTRPPAAQGVLNIAKSLKLRIQQFLQ